MKTSSVLAIPFPKQELTCFRMRTDRVRLSVHSSHDLDRSTTVSMYEKCFSSALPRQCIKLMKYLIPCLFFTFLFRRYVILL